MAGRLDRLLDWLFPRRCAFCGHPVETGQTACSRCREELPRIAGPVYPLCGREKGSCRCGQRRRAYRRCVSPFYYEGPAKRGILRLKLYGKVYAAEGFAQAMAETVRREYEGIAFDALVPVPISDSTRRERGYNQSERLASALGKGLAVPVVEGLVKVAENPPQRSLPASQRSGNVLGVFDCAPGFVPEGQVLLLVDDVSTTGATLDECAKMLKIYGAEEVYAVTAAAARLSNGG